MSGFLCQMISCCFSSKNPYIVVRCKEQKEHHSTTRVRQKMSKTIDILVEFLEIDEEDQFLNSVDDVNLSAEDIEKLVKICAKRGLRKAMAKIMRCQLLKHLDFTNIAIGALEEADYGFLEMLFDFNVPMRTQYNFQQRALELIETKSDANVARKKCLELIQSHINAPAYDRELRKIRKYIKAVLIN